MLSYNSEAPALGRGQMGHAPRVTEAGATPTEAVTHGASKGGVAPASSEFSRVLPGFLFMGYLRCFLRVRVTAKVKRIKARGEVPG
jgi:hypothetical protein